MDFRRGLRVPPLSKYIQGILEQYPDDGQILKELIQNADDAGATTVKLLLDETQYGTAVDGLVHPAMQVFQGPSLLVFNDAVFTEDDWNAICMMQESVKKEDVIKTGRFGLGFKSIFHVTDLPTILSGDYIGFIDPHQQYLPHERSAYNWHLHDDREFLQSKEQQFAPLFHNLLCSSKDILTTNSYKHTIFRFPLRNQTSDLSSTQYTPDKVLQLFQSLQRDHGQSLLFLKSVQCIEIYRKGSLSANPELLYSMEIGGNVAEVIEERNSFLRQVCHQPLKNVATLLEMTVNVVEEDVDGRRTTASHDWLVYHEYQAEKVILDVAMELKVLPWVGIAFQINRPGDNMYAEPSGYLFATLPLPLDGTERTGLPFHIHGYFAMEQNRRHLRWPTSDQARKKLDSAPLLWNQLLVNQCIPAAVVTFYKRAMHLSNSTTSITPHDLYNILPNPDAVDIKWQPLVSHVYKALFKEPCFYTSANGGIWVNPEDALLFPEQLPVHFEQLIEQLLIYGGFKVIKPPDHVRRALEKYSQAQPSPISASIVHDAALVAIKADHVLDKQDSLLLLRYFLQHGQPKNLLSLPLIPLLSGGMTSFVEATKVADPIFITSTVHPASLLPHLEHRMVDANLEEDLHALLWALAQKGTTQVQPLSFQTVLQNLQHTLPSSWTKTDVVNWFPEEDSSHPSNAWVEQIWAYIQHNHPTNDDWQRLDELHLLPIDAPKRLCRFSVGERIVLAQKGGHRLPSGICRFLSEVGVIVLSDNIGFVSNNGKLLDHYVQPPTCEGVVNALMAQSLCVGTKFYETVRSVATTNDQDIMEFLTYISDSGVNALPRKMKIFLRHVPLFETVNDSGFQPSMYVSIEEVNVSGPSVAKLPVPFHVEVIRVSSEKVRNVLEALGVLKYHKLSFAEILTDILVPAIELGKYTNQQVEDLVCYIIDTDPDLILSGSQLVGSLSKISFVTTCTGQQHKPSELHDPTDSLLLAFLDPAEFPHDRYKHAHLPCLRKLGLKTARDISSNSFLQIANSLHSQPEKAGDFMQLVKKLHENRPNGKWWHQLKDIAFLPTVSSKPDSYPEGLPWKGFKNKLVKPAEVCHFKYMKQIGSVLPLVDLDESVLRMLGARTKPSLDNGISQLKQIIVNYSAAEKSRYMLLLDDIYRSMTCFTGEEIERSLNQYELTDWIWSGSGFQGTKQLVLNQPEVNLEPYIVCIPQEMEDHRELLHKCGVPEIVELNSVLKMIAVKHEMHGTDCVANVHHDLQMAINIVAVLCKDSSTRVRDDPLLPTEIGDQSKLRLIPASQCTVWDGSCDVDDELHMVHRSVPPEVLTQLLVPTITQRALDGEEFSIGLESFGQTEPLTRRLKSILEGYTDGLAILKEMIQNADDAGATDISLIYDMRDNANHLHSLLDPRMAAWQGPTLWIHNNSLFTKEDFENIAKLNGATKMGKHDKIGAFGLGFNAVYNLTDVPSVLSGDTLTIFDPHTTFLGKAVRDKSKPGLRINIKRNGKLLHTYSDQFAPWNGICGCKLELDSEDTTYQGTLFRLPLRGHKESYCSEISNARYDHQSMIELLKMIYNHGSNMLLFSQNVLKISVSLIPKSDVLPSDARQLFEIKKEPIQYLRKCPISCELSRPSLMKDVKTREFISECSILKASMKNKEIDGKKHETKSSMIIASVVTTFEDAKSFLGEHSNRTQEDWLVSHCIETSNSTIGQGKKPAVAGIAIGLDRKNDNFILKSMHSANNASQGSFFSFLPLPIKCHLPFHINGTFILDQSRRHLLTKTEHDRSSAGGEWNISLMEGAVCTAYLTAIDAVIQLTDSSEGNLSGILPLYKEGNVMNSFTKAFWRKVIDRPDSPEVFSNSDGRVSFHNAYFLDRAFSELFQDQLQVVKQIISTVLAGTGKSLVSLSQRLEYTLAQVDPDVLRIKTITEERFFLEFFLPNLTKLKLDQKDRDSLLVKALQFRSDSVSDAMKCLACIPVSPNGINLACPPDLVSPFGQAGKLFCPEDSRFPYFTHIGFEDELSVCNKICELGMVMDNLQWSDVLERASSLQYRVVNSKRTSQEHTIQTVNALLRYLQWQLEFNGTVPEDVQKKLQHEKFLPAAERPEDWALKWKADSSFYNGLELYHLKEPLLACTQIPVLHARVKVSHDVASLLGIKEEGYGYTVNTELLRRQVVEIASNQGSLTNGSVKKSMELIYEFLEKECKDETKTDKICQLLRNERFLLFSSNKLAQPATCALRVDFQAPPYMHRLPLSLRKYSQLMKTIGVKEEFNFDDFIITLAKVKEDYGNDPVPQEVIGNILKEWHRLMKGKKLCKDLKCETQIYIPDTDNVLQPVESLCFNDSSVQHNILPYPLAHQSITKDFATMIGLQDIRTRALLERSRGIPYEQNLIEEIKSSLAADPNGNHLLLDLIQSADSSGANEIHFILDPRSHSTKSVFSNEWESLQGPSLCIYNDARLKIVQLDELLEKSSKRGNPDELNFYEPSFHSVFHLTDIPSVLATLDDGSEILCVYDPACQYVQGSTLEEPGKQYQDLELLRIIFPDVFTCYPENYHGKGTLVRLPLRTSAKSPISTSVKTCKDIENMLKKLATDAPKALPFLTCLKKIMISQIDPTGALETEEIRSTISETSQAELTEFRQHLKLQSQKYKGKNAVISQEAFKCVSYELTISSKDRKEHWSVVQQCGMNESDAQNLTDLEELQEIMHGGVAELKSVNKKPFNKSSICFIPFAQDTTLPVCLNGRFVIRPSSYQCPSQLGNLDKWNKYMGRVIASAYLMLIMSKQKNMTAQQCEGYYRLFPLLPEHKKKTWSIEKLIVQEFYNLVCERNVIAVSTSKEPNIKWTHLAEAYFLEPPVTSTQHHDLQSVIKGAKLCELPIAGLHASNTWPDLQRMLQTYCPCELSYLTPDLLMNFLKSPQKCNTEQLSQLFEKDHISSETGMKLVTAMLKFCKEKSGFFKELHLLPLLVTSDKKLGVFNAESPVYKGAELINAKPCSVIKPLSPKFLHRHFYTMFASTESIVFKELDRKTFCEELEKFLPHELCQNTSIPWGKCFKWNITNDLIESIWDSMSRIKDVTPEWLKTHAGHLSLLSVKVGAQSCLYPLSKADEVFENDDKGYDVLQILLRRDDIPIANSVGSVATSMLASWNKPRTVVYALHVFQKELAENTHDPKVALIFQNDTLLRYITDSIPVLSMDIDLLKDLPLFETLRSSYTALTGQCSYVIPLDIPMVDMDFWKTSKPGIIFLKEKAQFKALYVAVGCKCWTTADLYVEYIFPHFALLSDRGRAVHMNYVFNNLHDSPVVMAALTDLECMTNTAGTYCRPCDLYDPHIKLFSTMQGNDLPASKFCTPNVLAALRKCGMRCSATKEMLAEYARRVPISSETCFIHHTRVILEYIKKEVEEGRHSEYLKSLAAIPFIERQPTYHSSIFPDITNEVYVPLEGSAPDNCKKLVSAVVPLIPREYLCGFTKDTLDQAGIIRKPSCELVARNIRQICENVQLSLPLRTDQEAKFLNDRIDTCYSYITDMAQKDVLTDDVKEDLQSILSECHCIPINSGTAFIKPNQAILSAGHGEEIYPYLFRLPDNLIYNKAVLLLLGLHETPTTQTYQNVLRIIHEKVGLKVIVDEQDINAASQATRQVFEKIQNDKSLDVDQDLWLLSTRNCLCKAQELIYSNNKAMEERMKTNENILIDLDIRCDGEDVLQCFPETHRPQLMSAVFKEVIAHVRDADDPPNPLQDHLASEGTLRALEQLVYHIVLRNATEGDSDILQQNIQNVQHAVKHIKIRIVQKVKTCLTNASSGVVSEFEEKDVFGDPEHAVFYINQQVLTCTTSWVYLYKMLADLINQLSGGLFKDHLGILMVVLSERTEVLSKRLDEMKITRYPAALASKE